jgi:hypothetical protein
LIDRFLKSAQVELFSSNDKKFIFIKRYLKTKYLVELRLIAVGTMGESLAAHALDTSRVPNILDQICNNLNYVSLFMVNKKLFTSSYDRMQEMIKIYNSLLKKGVLHARNK